MDDNTTDAFWWAVFVASILIAVWWLASNSAKKHIAAGTSAAEPPLVSGPVQQPIGLERSAGVPRALQPTWSVVLVVALASGAAGGLAVKWFGGEKTREGKSLADQVDELRDSVDSLQSDVSSLSSKLRYHEH
jgi:hypothetical protein